MILNDTINMIKKVLFNFKFYIINGYHTTKFGSLIHYESFGNQVKNVFTTDLLEKKVT